MENSTKTFFPNLNGLRFFGALMVFVFHVFSLGKEIWGEFAQTNWFQALLKLTSKGHHGVGLFFTLSGFLITYLLLLEAQRKGSIRPFQFLMRRILRIWPLYYLILIFGFFIFPLLPFGQGTDHSLINYSFLLSNLDEIWHGATDPLNFLTITWSVSIEEQFYLTFIALLFLLPVFRKGNYFPAFFISIIAFSIVFRFIYFADERMMYYHTLANISDLAIGGLTALLVFKYNFGQLIRDLSRLWIALIYIFGISTLLFATKLFPDELRSIERLIQGAFFAFVVVEQAFCINSLFKMDRIPGFFKGGELTYGFYMYHCIYIYYWGIFFQNNGFTDHFWQFAIYFVVVLVCSYASAWLSMRYFEKPILRLKEKFR
jgi:peptidoglycan/LPS O-acetylase OafA/YrhL